jgi:hypothetical protein
LAVAFDFMWFRGSLRNGREVLEELGLDPAKMTVWFLKL